jgi:tetratricopeptide (TPR) repeat protein
MRVRTILTPVLVAILPVTVALAQPKKPAGKKDAPEAAASAAAPTGPQGQRVDPKGITGISPYTIKLLKADAAYASRDFAGAIAGYRDAIQDEPQNPLGFYLLGEAQLSKGDLAEAEASWGSSLRYVAENNDLHAKILFVMADLRERQGRLTDAKKAWDEYAGFCGGHKDAKGYPATATERNKVVDTHNDLETKYAAVKQRIEQRLKETPPPSDDGPQGPGGGKKR